VKSTENFNFEFFFSAGEPVKVPPHWLGSRGDRGIRMDQAIRFLKQHQGQIKYYLKKAFTLYKKRQGKTQNGAAGGSSSYATTAGGGEAVGGYGQQQQQQQQYQGQQQQYQGQQQQYGQQPYQQGGQQHYQGQQQPYYQGGQGNYDHPPPQGQYGRPTTTSPHQMPNGVKPNHGRYNDNEVNQKNEQYKQLRASAHREGDLMAKSFDESHKAYAQGDGGRAKQLSNQGHEHKQKMEQFNQQAADWIFHANNEDSAPNEVDLHGLYTEEAIAKTEQAIREHQQRGTQELRIIVGKGIHSQNHVAHIKPAVEKLMHDYNIAANIDPKNAGVLLVHLQGGQSQSGANFTRDLAQNSTGDAENVSGFVVLVQDYLLTFLNPVHRYVGGKQSIIYLLMMYYRMHV
jgi:DNA-nicking Smr family endonuclease